MRDRRGGAWCRGRSPGDYGALDLDAASGLVRGFREKAPKERNPYVERDGRRWTPINSGFSIIPNPRRPVRAVSDRYDRAYLTGAGARRACVRRAPRGAVKYEALYERVAADGRMVAVLADGYWTDLGTEEKIQAAEARLAGLGFV